MGGHQETTLKVLQVKGEVPRNEIGFPIINEPIQGTVQEEWTTKVNNEVRAQGLTRLDETSFCLKNERGSLVGYTTFEGRR